MSNICVIGTGYVGLVTGTCLAELGNQVICLDIDKTRIANLHSNIMPIYEPGLKQLVEHNTQAARLSFTTDYKEALAEAEFVFISVGTPPNPNGETDLRSFLAAAESIADEINHPVIIVNKSTVPVGTGDMLTNIIQKKHGAKPLNFSVVSNPEFLREGSAINDCMHPDRVVLGSTNRDAAQRVAELYKDLNCPIMITDLHTAEMIKYASNAFLATRISFINEISNICEALGADVTQVAHGMGLDKRIGTSYLNAGLGWGGSCLPKDVTSLMHMASIHGNTPLLLQTVMDINRNQKSRAVSRLREALGSLDNKVIAILGLAFKPNTDDVRDAPALEIIQMLQQEDALIQAYDPQGMDAASTVLENVKLCQSAYEAANNADALLLVTQWNEFKQLDFKLLRQKMHGNIIFDGRNLWDPDDVQKAGFVYFGVGHGS